MIHKKFTCREAIMLVRLKKTMNLGLIAAGMLAILFLLNSCFLTGEYFLSSRVVDARLGGGTTSAQGIANATVTVSGSIFSYTTTTDSDGYWETTVTGSGAYTLNVSKTGYYFPPQELYVGTNGSYVHQSPGVSLDPADEYSIVFLLAWNGQIRDLDMHLTFPNTDLSTDTSYFPDPYYEGHSYWNEGFGPATTNNRTEIYYGNTSYNPGTLFAYMDREDTLYHGPESIFLRQIPFTYDSGQSKPIQPTYENGLADLFPGSDQLTYRWMGVGEVYLSDLPSDTDRADAKIFCIQITGGAAGGKFIDSFTPPWYTSSGSASVIRVHMFIDSDGFEDFMLVADDEAIAGEYAIKDASHDLSGVRISGVRGTKVE
jgi:hypothetical protein